MQEWLKTGRFLWFLYGNISQKVAVNIVTEARQLLDIKSAPKEDLSDCRVVKLSEGLETRLDFSLEDEENENSCLMQYF
jgi:hypothetical protein